jgi:hypothetical protein
MDDFTLDRLHNSKSRIIFFLHQRFSVTDEEKALIEKIDDLTRELLNNGW